ncbi:Predicted oxidoreductase, contains short-chain dehydrogenase (SDR) and DUF2520 domains [Lachnospiraceae bacterium XBB1006]|nr:Predicted oxidoreductase, contains short-chain dehydrogenase (SDR) and DUF2520 domains [Lachnospiraceae bacterium XBB1006]
MRFGFIGAGKVGVSLGKYLVNGGCEVVGYYSKSDASAKAAADFTKTKAFPELEELVTACDAVVFTVPDKEIVPVYEKVKAYITKPTCFIHCSGLETSDVFYDRFSYHSYGYSIHPLLAVHSKYESYRELSKAVFTMEGDIEHREALRELFLKMGNPVILIDKEQKAKYHAACVFGSNLMLGLLEEALMLLEECGFQRAEAMQALTPLAIGNLVHGLTDGTMESLTGPVERADEQTIALHETVLNKEQRNIYNALSKTLLTLAKKKHPNREYGNVEKEIEKEREEA